MDDSIIIMVAAAISFIYFILGIGRRKNKTQHEPEALVSPDPAPESKPQVESEEEPEPQITFEELLQEFLPEPEKKNEAVIDEHFAPYALTETEQEDRALAIREERSLEPTFKREEVNLEKLAIKKVIMDEKLTRTSKSSSISELMQHPSDLRNAFILSQVLNRPYENDDTF